jgi:hypothetical protein
MYDVFYFVLAYTTQTFPIILLAQNVEEGSLPVTRSNFELNRVLFCVL